jgi:hypothetical protein
MRTTIIFFICKYEENIAQSHFHLFQIFIPDNTNNNLSIEHIKDFSSQSFFNFSQMNYGYRSNAKIQSQIFINKYEENGYIIFSQPFQHSQSSLIIYICKDKDDQIYYYDDNIIGFNVINSPISGFYVDMLTLRSGLLSLSYNNEKFSLEQKTHLFIKNLISGSLSIKGEEDRTPLRKSELPQELLFSMNKADNINEETLKKYLFEAFEYYEKYSNISAEQYTNNLEKDNLQRKISKFDYDTIINVVTGIFLNILDDENINVDNINRDSIKAELVIIEYLGMKEMRLDQFFDCLQFFEILRKFDGKQIILSNYIESKGKLIFALKLREFENNIINNEFINIREERTKKLNRVAKMFFEKVYAQQKEDHLKHKLSDKVFNKQLIYSKVTKIASYLESIIIVYNWMINDIQLSAEDKIRLSFILIKLFNSIIGNIRNFNSIQAETFGIRNEQLTNWLLDETYLKCFELVFQLATDDVKNTKISDLFEDEIINYIDNVLHLYESYYVLNNNSVNQRIFASFKRTNLGKIIELNYSKVLDVAKKYKDLYNVTYICYKYKDNFQLRIFLKEIEENDSMVKFVLKLFLLFVMEDFKSSQHKINFFDFTFFDDFSEYENQIRDIIKPFPKMRYFYYLYSKAKAPDSYPEIELELKWLLSETDYKDNIANFLKTLKALNTLNLSNYMEESEEKKDEMFPGVNSFNANELNFCLLINYISNEFDFKTHEIFDNFRDFVEKFIDQASSQNFPPNQTYSIILQLIALADEISDKFNVAINFYLLIQVKLTLNSFRKFS